MKLWSLWKKYVSNTEWNGRWWKTESPFHMFTPFHYFSEYLKSIGVLPPNVVVSELYKVFLHYTFRKSNMVEAFIAKWKGYKSTHPMYFNHALELNHNWFGLDSAVYYLVKNGYIDRWERFENLKKVNCYDINWYY